MASHCSPMGSWWSAEKWVYFTRARNLLLYGLPQMGGSTRRMVQTALLSSTLGYGKVAGQPSRSINKDDRSLPGLQEAPSSSPDSSVTSRFTKPTATKTKPPTYSKGSTPKTSTSATSATASNISSPNNGIEALLTGPPFPALL